MNDESGGVRQAQRGFTLIELIIAVAIVAILATIALPSYQAYVYRSNRAVAKTLLSQIQQQQETYFGDRKHYGSLYGLGYPAANDSAGIYIGRDGVPSNSANSGTIYSIRVTPLSTGTVNPCALGSGSIGTDYLIVAAPQGSQVGDSQCASLCLASTNERGSSVSGNGSTCWQR